MYIINVNPIIIVSIAVAVFLIIALILFFILRKSSFFKKRSSAQNDIIVALGNRENILECIARGSRLSLVLSDYDKVDEDKLKALGVSSIIKMSNKITLVIGEEASEIANLINNK